MRLLQSVRCALPPVAHPLLGIAGLLAALACPAPSARADVFHLKSGGRVEGELLEQTARDYRLRTTLGTVTVAADAVERVEAAPSPFREYEQRRAAAADTADDQTNVAKWCAEQGLAPERLRHLQRALELDPDHAAARAELGFVRVGELWVDGRTLLPRDRAAGSADASDTQNQLADNPQKLAAAIQGTWRRRIYGVRVGMLDSSLPQQVERGRQRIAEIKDPLAIIPLVQVLSEGGPVCREILVEALARFPEDAATVNVAALALADPVADIRHRAVVELARRQDSRVTAQFRKALESGDEVLIRRAAEALGALRAAEAIPDLVNVLKGRRKMVVEVPAPRYFGALGDAFAPAITWIGSMRAVVHPLVAVNNPVTWIELQRRYMQVTVFRTEVLEALRQITGQDFGFDAVQWARWYEESRT